MKKITIIFVMAGVCGMVQQLRASNFNWQEWNPIEQNIQILSPEECKSIQLWMQKTEKPEQYDEELHADDPYLSNDHVVDPEVLKEYEAFDRVSELRRLGFVPVTERPADRLKLVAAKRPQTPRPEPQ